MKLLPHDYDVHLTGGPSGYAVLSTPGIPDLRTAPPADFDGPRGVTRFTEIVLRPRLVVARGADRERALRMIEKREVLSGVGVTLHAHSPAITES